MKIHLLLTNPNFVDSLGRDNCNEPWVRFKNHFEAAGHEVSVIIDDKIFETDTIVYIDSHFLFRNFFDLLYKYFYFLIKNRIVIKYLSFLNSKKTKSKSILVLLEPESVVPNNFDPKYRQYFKNVFSWNKKIINDLTYFVQSPFTSIIPKVKSVPFNSKKLIVDISGNKFSNHNLELYSYRRELISYLNDNYSNEFDLFGTNWNKKYVKSKHFFQYLFNYKFLNTYRGFADDKFTTISNYRFCVCIENMKNINDYISQRLFDILHSKSIPLIYGANNIESYLPSDCYIDLRIYENDFKKLIDRLISFGEKEHESYLKNISKFLKSEKAKIFYSENFINKISSKIIQSNK